MSLDEIRAEIIERTDLVGLIGQSVELKKAGVLFKGCCPFHQERSASFTVSPVRRTYHCFGCGVHGDAIKFVRETQNLGYVEALRFLGSRCGVEVPQPRPESPAQREAREQKRSESERLLLIQDKVAAYFSDALFGPRAPAARAYLRERNIGRKAVDAFRLGYADGHKRAFDDFARGHGIDFDDLHLLGLVVRPDEGWRSEEPLWGGHLRFRERVMFPVMDLRGEVVGFGGRLIDREAKAAKYINSPETPIYTKGEQLYGAYQARQAARREGRLLLCEGNIDVIMCWQAGFEGTVAAMGTALTPMQVRLVKRLSEDVTCIMDGDAAGLKATFSSLLPFLDHGLSPRVVLLEQGDDPDSYLRSRGPTEGKRALKALLEAARPLLDVFIDSQAAHHPTDPPGRAAALRAVAPALSRVLDPLQRSMYWPRVAASLQVDVALVEQAVVESTEEERRRRREPAANAPAGQVGGPVGGRAIGLKAPLMDVFDGSPVHEVPLTGLTGRPVDAETFISDSSSPHVRPRDRELEALDLILQNPESALWFESAGGIEYLTHVDLAAFVARLCDLVRGNRIPSEDRLLMEFPEPKLRATVLDRMRRRPPLAADQVLAGLEQALPLLRRDWLVQRRRHLQTELKDFNRAGDTLGLVRCQAELSQVQHALKLVVRVEERS